MQGLSFFGAGRPGSDAALGVLLRVAGVAGLLLFAFGLVMAAMGSWTLIRLQAQGDQTGWDGLIGAIALMLGVMMVLGGVMLTVGAHAAFSGWRDRRPRPVRIAGWTFLGVGALAVLPSTSGIQTPLDLYMLVAGVAVLLLGVAMLAWCRRV